MPGLHTTDGSIWSEEYQVALLETYHRVFDRIGRRRRASTSGTSPTSPPGLPSCVSTATRRACSPGIGGRRWPRTICDALARRSLTVSVECRTTSSPKSSLLADSFAEHRHGRAPTSSVGQADGRERGRDHGRHRDIVETDDADVVGHGDPEAANPAMTPSAIWSLKASTAVDAWPDRADGVAAASNVGAAG